MPTMPNLSGMNFQEAQDTLEAAGIYVSYPAFAFLSPAQITVKWQVDPGESGGLVIGQTPADGATVAKGAAITLTLATFPMSAVIDPGY